MHTTVLAVAVSALVLLVASDDPDRALPTAVETAAAGLAHEFAPRLSDTGYFADVATLDVADGFVPYRVKVRPWSDGAFKQRFIRVPEGTAARFDASGALDLPAGTVLLQNVLILPRDLRLRRLETRVIVVAEEGLSFATYVWRSDQRDADLVTGGGRIDIETEKSFQLWRVTPTSNCIECHEADAGPILGFTPRQLDLDADGESQLEWLAARGVVAGLPEKPAPLSRLVDPHDETAPLELRARSYLDVNCSSCHRPGGNGSGTMDLRLETPREESGLGELHEIMLDGRPFDSWIYLRMIYTDDKQMPSELTTLVDEKGADLIREWVESKTQDEKKKKD